MVACVLRTLRQPLQHGIDHHLQIMAMGEPATKRLGTEMADCLDNAQTKVFNEQVMISKCGADVAAVFKDSVLLGKDLSVDMKEKIAAGVFSWARENGATSFAHWFFPCRMGGGAVGGTLGALKKIRSLILCGDLRQLSSHSSKPSPRNVCFAAKQTALLFLMMPRSSWKRRTTLTLLTTNSFTPTTSRCTVACALQPLLLRSFRL